MSVGSSESQSPELAIRIVPPVASDGLWIPPASAGPPAPPPVAPPLPEPVVLGPPQAASATAATAPSASAVSRRGFFLVLLISTLPRNVSATGGPGRRGARHRTG